MNDLIEAWRNHQHYVYRILAALVAEPERTAVIGADLTFSAGAFAQTVLAAAAALRRRGAGPDRTVAILTQANHPYMLAFRYAAHLLGATTVYIRSNNARSDEDMLPASAQVRMLAETGAGLLIADAANILRARDLCSELSCEPVTAELDVDPAGASAADLGRAVRALPAADYQPHRRLLVAYTSGSTGTPKGVCHSGQGWNNVVARFEAAVCRPLPSVFLAVTPAAQTVGAMLDGALAGGGAAVLHERFTADGVLQAWAELGVTDCYLAVPHLYALVDDTRTARTDLSGSGTSSTAAHRPHRTASPGRPRSSGSRWSSRTARPRPGRSPTSDPGSTGTASCCLPSAAPTRACRSGCASGTRRGNWRRAAPERYGSGPPISPPGT